MKFSVKHFSGISLAIILMVCANTGKIFAHSSFKARSATKHAAFGEWNLQHGEVERVESSGGQIQMASHRQPRPTHSVRHILNAFKGPSRLSLYSQNLRQYFAAAGFTRLNRLLLFPHHSFV